MIFLKAIFQKAALISSLNNIPLFWMYNWRNFYFFPFHCLIYIKIDVQESLLGSLWESLVPKWNK